MQSSPGKEELFCYSTSSLLASVDRPHIAAVALPTSLEVIEMMAEATETGPGLYDIKKYELVADLLAVSGVFT